MDFNPEQRLAITKSIIELIDPAEKAQTQSRFDDDAAVFYDNDRRGLPITHSRLLYITVSVNEVELKRAMLDPSSSIKIVSLSTLDAVGIPRDKIIRQPIKLSSFRGNKIFIIVFVNLDLTVGPMRAADPFQVIDTLPVVTW